MNIKKHFIFSLLLVSTYLLSLCLPSFAESKYNNLKEYKGKELGLKSTFQCKSKKRVGAGYWTDLFSNKTKVGASIDQEPNETTWRITLKGKGLAEVIRFSGANQSLEAPEIFNVEIESGLMLTSKNRPSGQAPQTITIDVNNSSFIYTSTHVNPMYNRTNVFIGTCRSGV